MLQKLAHQYWPLSVFCNIVAVGVATQLSTVNWLFFQGERRLSLSPVSQMEDPVPSTYISVCLFMQRLADFSNTFCHVNSNAENVFTCVVCVVGGEGNFVCPMINVQMMC